MCDYQVNKGIVIFGTMQNRNTLLHLTTKIARKIRCHIRGLRRHFTNVIAKEKSNDSQKT